MFLIILCHKIQTEIMFDNLIVNIRTILPTAKKNVVDVETNFGDCKNGESAIAFIERNVSSNQYTIQANNNQRTVLNVVRSYFGHLYGKKQTSDIDSLMLPRVYNYEAVDWDPIELKPKEKFIEDIDNVIDKFARVISVNETNSPRRTDLFYVQFFFVCFYFDFLFCVSFAAFVSNVIDLMTKCNLICLFFVRTETQ